MAASMTKPDDMKADALSAPKRKRMTRDERRKMIVDGAVTFFARHGFDASTHQLAEYLGVTQPLIYNYFPNKESLFRAVYEQVFLGRWESGLDATLSDRARPLFDRLCGFYEHYGEITQSSVWMRIYLYSGLKSLDMNRWYISMVEERIIRRICVELRREFGAPDVDTAPITPGEVEAVWLLHGGVFYYGVRKYVYQVPVSTSFQDFIRQSVRVFLAGAPVLHEGLGAGAADDRADDHADDRADDQTGDAPGGPAGGG